MLALFVDHDAIDAPDDLGGRREHVLHESLHVDMRVERRQSGVFAKRGRQRGASGEECGRDAGKDADAV